MMIQPDPGPINCIAFLCNDQIAEGSHLCALVHIQSNEATWKYYTALTIYDGHCLF